VDEGRPSDLRRTAYHEAGHAVVAYLLGIEFSCVSIEAAQLADGRVSHGRCCIIRWSQDGEKNATQCAAGRAAVNRLSCVTNEPWGEDWDCILKIGGHFGRDIDEFAKEMMQRATSLIEQHRSAVEALADALLRHHKLDRDGATAIIKAALGIEPTNLMERIPGGNDQAT
jgi:ATP-dependent Zn protease